MGWHQDTTDQTGNENGDKNRERPQQLVKVELRKRIDSQQRRTKQQQESGIENNLLPVPDIDKMARKERDAHLWYHLGQPDHPQREDIFR